MKPIHKKLMTGAIAAAAIAAVGAGSYAVTRKLMHIALDRDCPLMDQKAGKDKLRGSKELSEKEQFLEGKVQTLMAQPLQTVNICAEDGTTLIGHWYRAEHPKRTIIAMHGWRSTWARDFGSIADFWHSNDCNVLYAEQRGQGESGGAYMGFGLPERYDCLRWAQWVNETCGETLPVYLIGVSMGATTVLMAAGLELPKNVCGIVADCGFTEPHAIWKHVVEHNLHLPYALNRKAAGQIYDQKLQIPVDSASTIEAMQQCKVPVLFVHGTDDRFVPVEMTYGNYKACASEKDIFIVPGAGHGMSYFENQSGYEAAVLRFWEKHDKVC